VEETLSRAEQARETKCTEGVAVGSGDFVETVEAKPGIGAKGRRILGLNNDFHLLEPRAFYSVDFMA
jgi:hypothetical protein